MGPFRPCPATRKHPCLRSESVPLGLPGRDLVGQFLPAGSLSTMLSRLACWAVEWNSSRRR